MGIIPDAFGLALLTSCVFAASSAACIFSPYPLLLKYFSKCDTSAQVLNTTALYVMAACEAAYWSF